MAFAGDALDALLSVRENGVMNEHEYRTEEGSTSYEDSPWSRGEAKFYTAPMAENTEVIGRRC